MFLISVDFAVCPRIQMRKQLLEAFLLSAGDFFNHLSDLQRHWGKIMMASQCNKKKRSVRTCRSRAKFLDKKEMLVQTNTFLWAYLGLNKVK